MIAGTIAGWNRNESGAGTVIAHCAPKIRARQIISELEGTTRGPYAGCVGYSGNIQRSTFNLEHSMEGGIRGW